MKVFSSIMLEVSLVRPLILRISVTLLVMSNHGIWLSIALYAMEIKWSKNIRYLAGLSLPTKQYITAKNLI